MGFFNRRASPAKVRLSTQDIAKAAGYHPHYMAKLIREGKVQLTGNGPEDLKTLARLLVKRGVI